MSVKSHVAISFETPEYKANCDALGILRKLEVVSNLNMINKTKIYQDSTSEFYGQVQEVPQKESTHFTLETHLK